MWPQSLGTDRILDAIESTVHQGASYQQRSQNTVSFWNEYHHLPLHSGYERFLSPAKTLDELIRQSTSLWEFTAIRTLIDLALDRSSVWLIPLNATLIKHWLATPKSLATFRQALLTPFQHDDNTRHELYRFQTILRYCFNQHWFAYRERVSARHTPKFRRWRRRGWTHQPLLCAFALSDTHAIPHSVLTEEQQHAIDVELRRSFHRRQRICSDFADETLSYDDFSPSVELWDSPPSSFVDGELLTTVVQATMHHGVAPSQVITVALQSASLGLRLTALPLEQSIEELATAPAARTGNPDDSLEYLLLTVLSLANNWHGADAHKLPLQPTIHQLREALPILARLQNTPDFQGQWRAEFVQGLRALCPQKQP